MGLDRVELQRVLRKCGARVPVARTSGPRIKETQVRATRECLGNAQRLTPRAISRFSSHPPLRSLASARSALPTADSPRAHRWLFDSILHSYPESRPYPSERFEWVTPLAVAAAAAGCPARSPPRTLVATHPSRPPPPSAPQQSPSPRLENA